ncbi:MAG: glucosaminidase domain-containing protein [Bacteroidota bacterium]|nr:glucosaminidase domain-containing protein [Bacteroidota bacterium]MDP4211012.1 glucosaminidase domain-containing protein [Bacteroidota bacterium]MDP4248766.1 glucosaminidase domain-containing protein [Bacteroidota bacterium]
MKLKGLIFGVMMMSSGFLRAQNNDQILNYISNYKSLAISEMQRSGIPASIILAQGIHETEAGTSELVLHSNNHFGIKCKSTWTGQTVFHDDDARGECFRSYATAEESYRDHSDFLTGSPRYASLFKLNPEDYESWAYGLKKAGYATNTRYPQILIKLIQDYDLERYTLIAMGKLHPDEPVAVNPVTAENPRKTLEGFTDSAGTMQPLVNTIYPDGPFSINSARVIFAKAGISLLSLSNQYDVPLSRLLDFNDMSQEDILANDQLIFLQRKRKTGMNPVHIVRSGESLYSICQSEGIRYESLLELNRMSPGEEPAAGEKIFLQYAATSRPALKNLGYKKPAIPAS